MQKYLPLLASVAMAAFTSQAQAAATVSIDGSSSVFPITEAVAEEFQAAQKGAVRVTVGISGTGGGFKKFCRGELDISDASRPITKEEMAACRESKVNYIELPIAFDALTVATSANSALPDCLKVSELKTLWAPEAQGKVTTWNQLRKDLPEEKISLYGAGSDSGTFDYFTEATVGKAKASRGDYTSSEDDNVLVQGISSDKYALGYLPYAYYIGNAKILKPVAIDNGKGCVMPSPETAQDGTYSPLSRPLFLYVNAKAAERKEVKEFVDFYLKEGRDLVKEVHYLPLPETAYKAADERFGAKTLGTVFKGEPAVGVSVEEVLKRESVQ